MSARSLSLLPSYVLLALFGILYAYPARPSLPLCYISLNGHGRRLISTHYNIPTSHLLPTFQTLPAAKYSPRLSHIESSLKIGCAHCGYAHTIIDIPVEVSLCRRSRCRLCRCRGKFLLSHVSRFRVRVGHRGDSAEADAPEFSLCSIPPRPSSDGHGLIGKEVGKPKKSRAVVNISATP